MDEINLIPTFKHRKEQREVNETMQSLLGPIRDHADDKTKRCIDKTLLILSLIQVEEQCMSCEYGSKYVVSCSLGHQCINHSEYVPKKMEVISNG